MAVSGTSPAGAPADHTAAETPDPGDVPTVSGQRCRVCRYTREAGDAYFTWFAVDNGIDPAMIARLQHSAGMCPPHTRRILCQPEAATRLTTVYRHVLPALRDRLATDGRAPDPCPGCERDRQAARAALAPLTRAVRRQPGATRHAAPEGLCLPHLRQAGEAKPPVLIQLARTTAAQLPDAPDVLAALAGADPDAATRSRLRALLPAAGMLDETLADPATTLTRLQARLQTGACPLCLTHGQHERRYLAWLARQVHRDPAGLANEPGGLCPQHLHDLTATDAQAGEWALRREQRRWANRLRDALVGTRLAVAAAVRQALYDEACLVCRAVTDATTSETALLLAALAGAPLQASYPHTAGLCLRHAGSLRSSGPATQLVRQVALARLDLLIAELNDAARKTAWLARYDSRGPESTAWVRAVALIDGRVFLGGLPRTHLTPTAAPDR